METLRLGDVKWLAQYPGVSDGWNAALKPVIFAADSSLLTLYLLVSTFSWKEKKQNKTFFFFVFLGPHPQHTEVPGQGVESAYTTGTAMPDLSCVCDLHRSSQQHQILNPLSEVKDQTCILMDANQFR